MRKALIAVALLFALCLGGMAAVHAGVNEARDQVVITEKVLFGDKAHAEGLTIRAEAFLQGRLHWDTTYVIGEEPSTQTEYRFTAEEEYRHDDYEPSGLYTYHYASVYDFQWDEAESADELTGLDLAHWELFQETPAGEEGSRTIYMRDYYEYYPVTLVAELPNYYFDMGWRGYDQAVSEAQRANMEQLDAKLQEYLKIPMLPEEKLEISVTKRADGTVGGWGHGTGNGDRYGMGIYSAVTDNACYFIVSNRTYQGELVDLSLIPGGYGIHVLPFATDETGQTSVDVDGLSMVYPLDEESRVIWFHHTVDKSKLLLMTNEKNGECLLRVIDCETMDTLQEIVLYEITEERRPWVERCEEDYIIMRTSDGGILLLEEREDGCYDVVIDITVSEEEQISAGFAATHWDGQKLVLGYPLHLLYEERETGDLSGFAVAVYDASGALFGGRYTSSLDTKNYDYYDSLSCSLQSVDPLHISWRE